MNNPRNVWLLVLVLSLVSVAGTARAGTVTWTTTGDYDLGTKAPTSDENLGIETTTDNPGIASGAFELGSLKGDAFNTASADANTAKWNLHSIGICETGIVSIAGGVLNEDAECLTGGNRGVYGAATITGDWDVSVKLDKTVDTGTTNQWWFGLFSASNSFCAGLGEDGVLNLVIDGNIQAHTCINTVFAQVGTSTAVPSDPVWLRITRATNTFTWYYSTDGVSYTQDEQTTSASIPNPLIPYIEVYADSAAEPTGADWDDYRVNAGTVGAGGFRNSGQWTSASQTDTDPELILSIVLTYSGASAANYITSMEILDAVNAPIFTDGTDLTSGTSKTYTVPDLAPGPNWKVRVTLTGDGTGSPTITEITETSAAPPVECFGTSVFGSILFAIFGIVAGVAIVTAVYYAATKGAEGMDVVVVASLIIGIVVLLAIVGSFLGVFQTGATIGC